VQKKDFTKVKIQPAFKERRGLWTPTKREIIQIYETKDFPNHQPDDSTMASDFRKWI